MQQPTSKDCHAVYPGKLWREREWSTSPTGRGKSPCLVERPAAAEELWMSLFSRVSRDIQLLLQTMGFVVNKEKLLFAVIQSHKAGDLLARSINRSVVFPLSEGSENPWMIKIWYADDEALANKAIRVAPNPWHSHQTKKTFQLYCETLKRLISEDREQFYRDNNHFRWMIYGSRYFHWLRKVLHTVQGRLNRTEQQKLS